MRGFVGCGLGPGPHEIGPFGHVGADRFGCRFHRYFGPHGHHFGPPGRRFGYEFCTREKPFFYFNPHFTNSESCQNCSGSGGPGFERGPFPGTDEQGPRGPPHFGPHGPEGRHHGPHFGPGGENGPNGPPHCGPYGPRDHSRERSPRRSNRSPCHGGHHGSHGHHDHGPWHGLPHEDSRQHDRRGRCHGSPPHHESCRRRNGTNESGLEGRHGHHMCGPQFDPHFGPHRRPFGPWNRRGNDQCCRDSDEETGNQQRGKKNRSCCNKNKDHSREETILVQKIMVEQEPRCNSV